MTRRRLWLPLDVLIGRAAGRAPNADPERSLADKDERDQVIAALRGLRPKDRELVLLLVLADVGVEQAARSLGLSVSAVKMRASRAKKRLRVLLEETDEARRRGRG